VLSSTVMCSSTKSVTSWSDVLALNWWANVGSVRGRAASIVLAAAIAVDAMGPSFEASVAAIWLLGLVAMLLVASANLLRKGAVGPKSFTVSADEFGVAKAARDSTMALDFRRPRRLVSTS